MAAPSEVIAHGTSQTLLAISDEPAVTPTVKVAELDKKYASTPVATKNINGTTVYEVETDRHVVLSYKGQVNADTGLAAQAPGSAVTTVANFAATDRTFDPAVGIFVLENITDSTKNLDRAPNTSFDIRHLQFVV